MTQLTKQQAAMLYAYDYKMVDKEGREYRIVSITESGLSLFVDYDSDWKPVLFSRIGTDYFILARPLSSLTTEIEHNGEKFVPIRALGYEHCDGELGILIDCHDNHRTVINPMDYFQYIEGLLEWNFDIGFPEHTVKHLI